MLKHTCLCGDELSHPESPARLERIIAKIADSGALARSDDSKILMRYSYYIVISWILLCAYDYVPCCVLTTLIIAKYARSNYG